MLFIKVACQIIFTKLFSENVKFKFKVREKKIAFL